MRYRTLTTVFTAAALLYAPTAGFAQSTPQPAASHESGLRLSDGSAEDDDDDLVWYILGGVAVVVLVFLLFLDDDDDEDLPVSP
jgi:hypothetical protein